jgi:hypothetical protein
MTNLERVERKENLYYMFRGQSEKLSRQFLIEKLVEGNSSFTIEGLKGLRKSSINTFWSNMMTDSAINAMDSLAK